ncbi:MAG TPA: amidohydrolase/deacetylase family metallohydrolase [Chloroflexota bacterium]|nr:amidohydrolase/deacetylase family metallohydrolase [Chloroflexota bacterium]
MAETGRAQAADFDLLVRGGTVVDPAEGINARRDVGIREGVIAAVAVDLPLTGARRVVDATGLLVTPGLIDLHAHVFFRVNPNSIEATPLAARSGTTTMVDPGSGGAATFDAFRHFIVAAASCRILAFLNISIVGTIAKPECGYGRFVDPNQAYATAVANRDLIVGIKVRGSRLAFGEDNTVQPVWHAKAAASAAGLPVMLHLGDPPPTVEQSIPVLGGGDIVTHSFKGQPVTRLVDHELRVKPVVRAARERGVLIDVGHGSGSFSWPVARAMTEQGYWPDTISTDAHKGSLPPPIGADMPNVMSKFLHLGMPLEDVIRASTIRPAETIGWADRIGSLAPGKAADVALFALEDGAFPLTDSYKTPETARQRLVARTTICGGRVLERPDAGDGHQPSPGGRREAQLRS